jgi:hypothetical protein
VLRDRVDVGAEVRVLIRRQRRHAVERRTAHAAEADREDGQACLLERGRRVDRGWWLVLAVLLPVGQNHHNSSIHSWVKNIEQLLRIQ